MKYKIYFKGTECRIPGYMIEPSIVSSFCPVSTGGDITVFNDTLHINEENGLIDISGSYPASEDYHGIQMTLESGNDFFATLISPEEEYVCTSRWGGFFDLGWEYEPGNIIKLYNIGSEDFYNICDGDFSEQKFSGYPSAVIVLENDQWQVTRNPRYVGNTVILDSGEHIYVSGISNVENELGVYFSRSSGLSCFAFYEREGENIQETEWFYFGRNVTYAQDGDKIKIYGGDYASAYDLIQEEGLSYQDEDVIAEYCPLLCVLEYSEDTHMWSVTEDYSSNPYEILDSCSVIDGGELTLPNGDILYISPADEPIEQGGDAWGIKLSLESGNAFFAYLIAPGNGRALETAFGHFDGYHGLESSSLGEYAYAEGNILKVYCADIYECFEPIPGSWIKYSEQDMDVQPDEQYTIQIINSRWSLLATNPYTGNTVTLNSGEKVFVSNISSVDYVDNRYSGIYFTVDSGNACLGYYKRDGDLIHETANYYFEEVYMPTSDDTITIYEFEEGENYGSQGMSGSDFEEGHVEMFATKICVLGYNESTRRWHIIEDYT